jgi:hypothetical protein
MRTRRGKRRQMASGKCTMVTGKGIVCDKECKPGNTACGIHRRAYNRDNPSTKLEPTDTDNAKAVIRILDAMRTPEGKRIVDNAFVELFVTREIFNPADNVNKFVTGGVAEDVVTELVGKLGFPVENVASVETVIDIKVTVDGRKIGISLKNSGSIDQQPILENYRGESKADIRPLPPTLIVYTETRIKRARIVYIDDDILRKAFPDLTQEDFNSTVYNKKKDDDKQSSLSFKSGFLKTLVPRLPESYIVNATFPEKIPKVDKKSITLLALEYVRLEMSRTPKGEVEAPAASEPLVE